MKKYDFYRCNKTVLLDGEWSFKSDFNDVGKSEQWYVNFPENAEKTMVPSCWNRSGDNFERHGVVWYSRNFFCESGNFLLTFNAVADMAEVYVDGKFIGDHYGAYTAFSFELNMVSQGIHNITVKVDDTKNSTDTLPLREADWYHYGGIIRSVELMPFDGLYVSRLKIDYELNDRTATVRAEVKCSGVGSADYDIFADGQYIKTVKLSVGINGTEFLLKDIEYWCCENPRLYNIEFISATDSITERIGFRTLSVSDNGILLNGKKIILKGINRHDEHPEWGFAVPDQLEERDFKLIKQLGCNSLRGAHYPQKESLIDLCDEYGVLFWSEIPLWQYPAHVLKQETVFERSRLMMEEMISHYYNHPSIFVWGLHNECSTETEEGVAFTEKLYKTVRKLDSKRLITYASDRPLEDECFRFCDFISVNKYFGWYEGDFFEWYPFFNAFEKILHEKGFDSKPVVISEFGAAALYGHNTFEKEKWTEEYQSECIENALKIFAQKPYICGTFVWQFSNIRVSMGGKLDRAHGYNNKGILDEYRRPKKAYYTLRDFYTALDDNKNE